MGVITGMKKKFHIFIVFICFFGYAKTQENLIKNTSELKDYELAAKFMNQLKSKNVDTVIYYKRTCINCCDFYNIFWVRDGKATLNKYYFDFDDMKTHSASIAIPESKIFEIVYDNFEILKDNRIKDNVAIADDGQEIISYMSHYCYSLVNIYLNEDSITTKMMKDADFNPYNSYDAENKRPNKNYQENLNSKWNKLLTAIENEIIANPKTSKREIEKSRIKK